jgi:hypothetical protein
MDKDRRPLSRVFMTLLLAGTLLAAAPSRAIAQPVDLQGLLNEMSFSLPGPGWQRVEDRLEPGQVARSVQYRRTAELHIVGISAQIITLSPLFRGLAPGEQTDFYFASAERSLQTAGRTYELTRGDRAIAGRTHPIANIRIPGEGTTVDLIELLYYPDDFGERQRFYSLLWSDVRSEGVPARGLEEFDAWVASFAVRPLGTVLLADDFSDAQAGLLLPSSPTPTQTFQGYVDGEYIIQKLDPDYTRLPGAVIRGGTHGNYTVAVDARLVEPPGGATVSVACRRSGTPESGYRLFVSDFGRFRLVRFGDDTSEVLVDWRTAAAIGPGETTNRIELSCVGSTISVTINGVELASVQDSTYLQGSAWVGIGGPPGMTVEGHFDNLEVIQR